MPKTLLITSLCLFCLLATNDCPADDPIQPSGHGWAPLPVAPNAAYTSQAPVQPNQQFHASQYNLGYSNGANAYGYGHHVGGQVPPYAYQSQMWSPYFAAYPAPNVPAYTYDRPYPPMIYSPIYTDVYSQHFGPGIGRNAIIGHQRFPYYSYRRPWYHPGPAFFNRNSDIVW